MSNVSTPFATHRSAASDGPGVSRADGARYGRVTADPLTHYAGGHLPGFSADDLGGASFTARYAAQAEPAAWEGAPEDHLRFDDSRPRHLASECICGEPGCTRWYER